VRAAIVTEAKEISQRPLQLVETETRFASSGEVLLRVRACGVPNGPAYCGGRAGASTCQSDFQAPDRRRIIGGETPQLPCRVHDFRQEGMSILVLFNGQVLVGIVALYLQEISQCGPLDP